MAAGVSNRLWSVEELIEAVVVRKVLQRVYRLGPVSITALIIVASVAYSPWSKIDDVPWLTYTLWACLGIALLWHLSLIASEENKPAMLLYAIIHLPVMFIVGFICGGSLTDFP